MEIRLLGLEVTVPPGGYPPASSTRRRRVSTHVAAASPRTPPSASRFVHPPPPRLHAPSPNPRWFQAFLECLFPSFIRTARDAAPLRDASGFVPRRGPARSEHDGLVSFPAARGAQGLSVLLGNIFLRRSPVHFGIPLGDEAKRDRDCIVKKTLRWNGPRRR